MNLLLLKTLKPSGQLEDHPDKQQKHFINFVCSRKLYKNRIVISITPLKTERVNPKEEEGNFGDFYRVA